MRVRCIDKTEDKNGKATVFTLVNILDGVEGKPFNVNKEDLLSLFEKNYVKVSNLKLSSNNEIVDTDECDEEDIIYFCRNIDNMFFDIAVKLRMKYADMAVSISNVSPDVASDELRKIKLECAYKNRTCVAYVSLLNSFEYEAAFNNETQSIGKCTFDLSYIYNTLLREFEKFYV